KRTGLTLLCSKGVSIPRRGNLAVTLRAEPHFLMKGPSRMVVMENLPPQRANGSQVETADVRYIGNSSDYFRTAKVPELADRDYRQPPVSLLRARQAINLAKYPGASEDATDELHAAEDHLQAAEKACGLGQPATEVAV